MMMRWMVGAVLALMLGACGEESDDFSISVKRSPDAVLSGLTRIDVSQPSAMVAKPITRTFEDGGIIEYRLPAAEGHEDGIVRLTVTGNTQNRTKVLVMVDVPAVEGYFDGGPKVVSERKVENVLRKDLQSWAKGFENGTGGEYANAELEASLTSVAIVLQNISGTGLMENGNATLFDAEPANDWHSSERDFAYGNSPTSNSGPMSDPSDDASSYGDPMDDAVGDDTDSGWGD